ncbi:MAG: transcriptional repressor LexA [Clostridiales bacterium]|jgi:repressor LexA|nr:transcriptional repressor LexA [Clostridiales bacterium]NLZ90708.1 transcriptional repressor LexA [Clostridiales bacterium]HOC09902.1 transcriptional repressor LexA [Bacillota bacterium]HQD41494.1 transcriptional repressor LexA [Bacillota bacterium]
MKKKPLSGKQLEVLEFIKSELFKKGYPPSVREICEAVGLKSTSTVHGHLERLERKGLIRRDPTKPRAIEVLDSSPLSIARDMVEVPIVGKVTAGQPILAVENIEDTFPLPADFLRGDDSFILTVRGESMIEAGILDGDYVVVKQQNYANNGDIVVALIEDEATVKRFYKEKDHIRLQPENSLMEPILVQQVTILGKVTGVFRRL